MLQWERLWPWLPLSLLGLLGVTWLGGIGLLLADTNAQWQHVHDFQLGSPGFQAQERPKEEIEPRLKALTEHLREQDYEVWVKESWVNRGEEGAIRHTIRFRDGWSPRISGEVSSVIVPSEDGFKRKVRLRLGGPNDAKEDIENLGLRLREILLYG